MDRKLYLIDRFFTETLTEEENREFEEYARTDEEFRRMMVQAIEMHGWFNEFLGEKENGAQGEGQRAKGAPVQHRDSEGTEGSVQGRERTRNPKLFLYTGIGIAAVAIIGLVLGVLLRAPLNERMYAENFAPFEIDNSRSAQQNNEGSILLPLYQNKEFGSIRSAADISSNLEKFSDLDYLLAGIAYMEGSNFGNAEKMLSTIKDSSEHYYNAAWYLGLIRLHRNQAEECIQYMNIAKESLVFSEKALGVIEGLKDEN
ncbi:MAG: hypothetical protein IH594_11675 [Bacteroidales bacterium]|nr:hypothetical protein [Bacteroidales bacterium]